jgi:hypothetical protein
MNPFFLCFNGFNIRGYMTTGKYIKIAFPVGYHDFHKDPAFNFQLNRWYSMAYAEFENLKEVGQKINSFEEWKQEVLKLAEIAVSEDCLLNAAFFYRAAESFITQEDPDKELLYHRFIDIFCRALQDDALTKYEVPYGDTFLKKYPLKPSMFF